MSFISAKQHEVRICCTSRNSPRTLQFDIISFYLFHTDRWFSMQFSMLNSSARSWLSLSFQSPECGCARLSHHDRKTKGYTDDCCFHRRRHAAIERGCEEGHKRSAAAFWTCHVVLYMLELPCDVGFCFYCICSFVNSSAATPAPCFIVLLHQLLVQFFLCV